MIRPDFPLWLRIEVLAKGKRSMSDQTPYSQYSQNPYSGDPQWPSQPQEGYPPAGEPNRSSIPPTQYAQPYAGSPSPYPSMPNQPGYGVPNPYAPYSGVGVTPSQLEPGRGQAVAGLVLGIIGLLAWLVPLLGVPVSIVGIVLSALGRRSVSRRTMATVGLVLSIISLVLTIGLFFAVFFATLHRSTP